MTDYMAMEKYRREYFPICALNIFIGFLSVACLLAVVKDTYLRELPAPQAVQYLQILGWSLVVMILCCNIMISQGYSFWLLGAVAGLVICLLGALCAIVYRPDIPLYVLSILFPLLGFLLFNSKRHRVFFKRFVEFRHERALARQQLAALHQLDGRAVFRARRRDVRLAKARKKTPADPATARRESLEVTTPDLWVFWIVAVSLVFIIGGFSYLIYDGLVSEVITDSRRYGPRRTYTLANEPEMYWFTISWDFLIMILLVLFLLADLWVLKFFLQKKL